MNVLPFVVNMTLSMQLRLLNLKDGYFILDYLSGHNLITSVLKIEEEGRGECQRNPTLEKAAGERQSMKKIRTASVAYEDRGRGPYASLQNLETALSWQLQEDEDLSPPNTGTEFCQQLERARSSLRDPIKESSSADALI